MSMTISVGDDRDDDQDERGVVDRDDDDFERSDFADERSTQKRRAASGDDESDGDDGDDDKSPEELRDEVRRLRVALQKSNSTGQRRRQQLKDLQAAQRAVADVSDDDSDDEDEKPAAKSQQGLDAKAVQRMIEKARKETQKEEGEKHRRELLTLRAESKLTAAGVSEKAVRLLKKEIDFDDFELDADDEIDRLRVEYPDLFKRTRGSGRRINGGDDRDGGGKRRPMSATELQVAKLTRGARS